MAYKKHPHHGMYGTKPYTTWHLMKQRCNNKNHPLYHRYGGRGISYSKKWETFKGFWSDMGHKWRCAEKKYSGEVLSIDRTNNDGNYTKNNCRIIPKRMNKCQTFPLNKKGSVAVWMCDKVTKKRIKRFPSMAEVERQGVALHNAISRACNDTRIERVVSGYKWEIA